MIGFRFHILVFAVCVALVLASAGCDPVFGPDVTLPPEASPIDPLESYALWYAQTEECTGETGDFSEVRWYGVPYERWWDPIWEQYAIGTWRAPHDIYLSEAHLENHQLVKHEIVHDLLRGGDADDPRFERCSGISH